MTSGKTTPGWPHWRRIRNELWARQVYIYIYTYICLSLCIGLLICMFIYLSSNLFLRAKALGHAPGRCRHAAVPGKVCCFIVYHVICVFDCFMFTCLLLFDWYLLRRRPEKCAEGSAENVQRSSRISASLWRLASSFPTGSNQWNRNSRPQVEPQITSLDKCMIS